MSISAAVIEISSSDTIQLFIRKERFSIGLSELGRFIFDVCHRLRYVAGQR